MAVEDEADQVHSYRNHHDYYGEEVAVVKVVDLLFVSCVMT
jgi:hypothetical protein